MFCQYCGKEVDSDAAFCPSCGAKLKSAADGRTDGQERDEFFKEVPPPSPVTAQHPSYAQPAKTNTMAVVGFILSFFVTIAGLICSIIGYKQCNETGEGGKGFAIAGIVISAVAMAIAFIAVIIVISTGASWIYGYYY